MKMITHKIFYIGLLICLVSLTNKLSAQFVPMQSAQYKHLAADTLYDFTGNGAPTVHPRSYKRVVTYFDSTNGIPYWHNPKTQTWVTVSGGGGPIDSADYANLSFGYGFIIFDENPYNPATGAKAVALDTSLINRYIDSVIATDTTISQNVGVFDYVVDTVSNTPPVQPDGYKVLVGTSPTGAFAGHANQVATKVGGVYTYVTPTANQSLEVRNQTQLLFYKYDGANWHLISIGDLIGGISGIYQPDIGTRDSNSFTIKTKNIPAIRIDEAQDVYLPKFIGIPSNNFAKWDTITGKFTYDIFHPFSLTTDDISGPATFDTATGILNIPQYSGGGGSQDLQSVTDIGFLTTHPLVVWDGTSPLVGIDNFAGNGMLSFGDASGNAVNITANLPTGTNALHFPNANNKTMVTSVRVNGTTYDGDDNGLADLGTIGGSGSTPSWQEVTDVGANTDHEVFAGGYYGSYGSQVFAQLNRYSLDGTNLGGQLTLKYPNSSNAKANLVTQSGQTVESFMYLPYTNVERADTILATGVKIGSTIYPADGFGQINLTGVAGGAAVTSVGLTSTDFSVSGSPITSSGNITANLNTSGVSAGSYTNANITVNNKGIVTSASNGSAASTAAGNYGNLQINRNSAFNTPASDSLSFNSGVLTNKGSSVIKGTATITTTATGTAGTDSVLVQSNGLVKKISPTYYTDVIAGASTQVAYFNTASQLTSDASMTRASSILNLYRTSIGTSTVAATINALNLENTTASTSGATVQNSPAIVLAGRAWNTTAPGNDATNSWQIYNVPQSAALGSGITAAGGTLTFKPSTGSGTVTFGHNGLLTAVTLTGSNGLQSTPFGAFTTVVSAPQVFGGAASSSASTYRTTNAGSDITPSIMTTKGSNAANNQFITYDATNGLGFGVTNDQAVTVRAIQRSRIYSVDLTNTNGSEAGGLAIATQTGGTAATEKARLTASGSLLVGTTTEAASSKLTVTSTTQGILPPRMTTAQKNAISSPAEGLMVYDTDLHKLYVYDGTTWQAAW